MLANLFWILNYFFRLIVEFWIYTHSHTILFARWKLVRLFWPKYDILSTGITHNSRSNHLCMGQAGRKGRQLEVGAQLLVFLYFCPNFGRLAFPTLLMTRIVWRCGIHLIRDSGQKDIWSNWSKKWGGIRRRWKRPAQPYTAMQKWKDKYKSQLDARCKYKWKRICFN